MGGNNEKGAIFLANVTLFLNVIKQKIPKASGNKRLMYL